MAASRQPRDARDLVSKLTHKPQVSASNLSAQRAARLLLVEDDEQSRDIATRWLRRHGYDHIDSAVDGERGLATCIASAPDIIILDHALPGLSGQAIAEHLCVNFKREDRPWIVLFTAAADCTVARLMSTGYFDDLLRKPCTSEDYLATLARAHAGLRARRQIRDHRTHGAASSSSALHL